MAAAHALDVARRLHQLCLCKENRSTIARDKGCLPALVLFLGNIDAQVVVLALQSLELLAEDAASVAAMAKELGFNESLQKILSSEDGSLADARAIAGRLKKSVEASLDGDNAADESSAQTELSRFEIPSFFSGASVKRSRLVVLCIEGLDGEIRDEVEECLLNARGVVSFTLELARCRVLVRLRQEIAVDDLFKALADYDSSLRVSQIVKTPSGEELALDSSYNMDPTLEPPRYLDEDELDPDAQGKTVASASDIRGMAEQFFTSVGSYVRSWW